MNGWWLLATITSLAQAAAVATPPAVRKPPTCAESLGSSEGGGMGAVHFIRMGGKDYAAKFARDDVDVEPHTAYGIYNEIYLEKEAAMYNQLNPNNDDPYLLKCYGMKREADTGKPFLLFEKYPGETPSQVMLNYSGTTKARLAKAVDLSKQMFRALVHVHKKGAAHFDIKPHNYLSGPAGMKIIDLGLAKKRHPAGKDNENPYRVDVVLGTEGYVSPEMKNADFDKVGLASDYFS